MKILVLIMFLAGPTWLEDCEWLTGSLANCTEKQSVIYSEAVAVTSAEEAAIILWKRKAGCGENLYMKITCPDCQAKLYEVTLPAGTFKEIPLPPVRFGECPECQAPEPH